MGAIAPIKERMFNWQARSSDLTWFDDIARKFNASILPMILPPFLRNNVCASLFFLAGLLFASTPMAHDRMLPLAASLGTETAAVSISLHNIEFKAGHPTTNETLFEGSSGNSEVVEQLLQEAVDFLNRFSAAHITVHGFTDLHECANSACDALSLRRATLVYEWLLQHGAASSQLSGPAGHGSMSPIDNESDEGRQRNRRVEFEFGL